jgi:hypothetical protein
MRCSIGQHLGAQAVHNPRFGLRRPGCRRHKGAHFGQIGGLIAFQKDELSRTAPETCVYGDLERVAAIPIQASQEG